MIKKTMKVRENTFRKLEDPFENGAAKKYVFYVKVDDVAEGIPMATNPRDQKLTSGVATATVSYTHLTLPTTVPV